MNTTENSTGTISNVLTMIRMSKHSLDDVSSRSHHRSFLTAITISSHFCSVPDMGYFHSAVRQLGTPMPMFFLVICGLAMGLPTSVPSGALEKSSREGIAMALGV